MCYENKIPVTLRITVYAFSRTAPRKSGPFGAARRAWFVLERSWRLGVESFLESIDDSGDAMFNQGDVKVDEQPQPLVGQLQISQKLLLVYRCDSLQRLDLHEHFVLHHEVCVKPQAMRSRMLSLVGPTRLATTGAGRQWMRTAS
jgi:hypothetical protein